ncbi:membrane protein [Acinetobacter junii]|nr:membrane protein [Acinetobacter junii]
MHITVAMMVAYLVTGNLIMAATLSLLEPTVQAIAFFFHEKVWSRF